MLYIGYDYILRLEVTVSYSEVMEVINCLGNMTDNSCCLTFLDFAFFKFLVKSTAVHILKDNVEMSFVIEVAVHAQDVRMVETTLQSYLKC
jgi:hypothetical protein